MLVSIIMPFYNHIELIHARLNEFRQFVPKDDTEIILIDDGSTDGDVDGIVGFWQNVGMNHIRYFKNFENSGFGFSMNKGAARANGDILIFYSNDVVAKSNFVDEVASIIGQDNKVLVGGEYYDTYTGWNRFDDTVIPYLNGWFLACTKEAWKELGGFDQRYGISDFEDIDLSYSASKAGFRLTCISQSKLRHLGGQTAGYGPDRRKRTIENASKFKEKWGFTQWVEPKS